MVAQLLGAERLFSQYLLKAALTATFNYPSTLLTSLFLGVLQGSGNFVGRLAIILLMGSPMFGRIPKSSWARVTLECE
jgi:hypothetical protein